MSEFKVSVDCSSAGGLAGVDFDKARAFILNGALWTEWIEREPTEPDGYITRFFKLSLASARILAYDIFALLKKHDAESADSAESPAPLAGPTVGDMVSLQRTRDGGVEIRIEKGQDQWPTQFLKLSAYELRQVVEHAAAMGIVSEPPPTESPATAEAAGEDPIEGQADGEECFDSDEWEKFKQDVVRSTLAKLTADHLERQGQSEKPKVIFEETVTALEDGYSEILMAWSTGSRHASMTRRVAGRDVSVDTINQMRAFFYEAFPLPAAGGQVMFTEWFSSVHRFIGEKDIEACLCWAGAINWVDVTAWKRRDGSVEINMLDGDWRDLKAVGAESAADGDLALIAKTLVEDFKAEAALKRKPTSE